MLGDDLRLLIAVVVAMAGLGAFLLCSVVLDLIGTAVLHLWLSASPGAARQARFRAALAAYQDSFARHARKKR